MTLAFIILVAVAIVAIVGFIAYNRMQSKKHTGALKDRFGTEYDRTVEGANNRKQAERELDNRQKRVEKFDIKPLADTARADYVERWRLIQTRFVDDPQGVVREADSLVNNVMNARGYPMATWQQRADDVSVDHPQVVSNYRAAHEISQGMEAGRATTEQLRQAMVHYRTLFEDLLTPEPVGARR